MPCNASPLSSPPPPPPTPSRFHVFFSFCPHLVVFDGVPGAGRRSCCTSSWARCPLQTNSHLHTHRCTQRTDCHEITKPKMPTADITKLRFVLKYNDSSRCASSITVIMASTTNVGMNDRISIHSTHQYYSEVGSMFLLFPKALRPSILKEKSTLWQSLLKTVISDWLWITGSAFIIHFAVIPLANYIHLDDIKSIFFSAQLQQSSIAEPFSLIYNINIKLPMSLRVKHLRCFWDPTFCSLKSQREMRTVS